ncbi:MAG: oligopeptide/dipeptide ABC transporter ATP-binding protein [Halapricum sp.]
MPDGEPILRVEGLKKYFDASEGFIDNLLGRSQDVKAVDGVDLELHRGETLGVVGESGCGKTTLGRALLRLIEPTEGSVYYRQETEDGTREEVDLTTLSSGKLRSLRTDLQYIFQDPFSSLNPRMTVGNIIGEPLDIHDIATGQERTDRIYELLDTVGLNPAHSERYPHEFSGGQRQRIGIARALAVNPDVIVCDEPVSALDVSVQAQILNLLEDLQDEFGLSYIFIAHDLSVVEHISDRVGVLYLGEFVEKGTTEQVFDPPHHPYTEALLSAIPEPDPNWESQRVLLSGDVPSPIDPPSGCRFHTRCPHVIQPDDFDIEQTAWRSLMDLKLRLQEAETLNHVTAVEEDYGDPAEASRSELDELVRVEFGLPDQLSPEAERPFEDIIDHLFAEDIEGAQNRIEEAYVSPCERTHPDLIETSGGHEFACLLYEDEYSMDQGPPGIESDDAAAEWSWGG